MSVKSEINARFMRLPLLTALCALFLLGATACGGDDEAAGELSTDDRLLALEAQMAGFTEYIVAQTQKEQELQSRQVIVEVGEDGEETVSTTAYIAPPLYSLRRADASENEQEIVLWMADCAARSYLNPDLPKEVIDREITETESRMWAALESGQYSSFENYIGMAFRFCQARIVEDGESE